jgi:AraC-like DNA-binding protein
MAMRGSQGTVQRAEIRTTDRDAAFEAARQVAAHTPRIVFDRSSTVDFRLRTAYAQGFGTNVARLRGLRYGADTEPVDFLLAGVLDRGRASIRGAGQEVTPKAGDGFVYPLGVPYSSDFLEVDLIHVVVPFGTVADLAEETTGLLSDDLRFEALTPISAPMRDYWTGTVHFLAGQLDTPSLDVPPLVCQELARLAATALLVVFPNTSMTAAHAPPASRATPAVVRRAVAFVDAHAEAPVTVTEIARVAGVGPRTLQEAFRRHLDSTPMEYLRRVRLERAHRELQLGDPAFGVKVADVARRWGFTNLSRFAAAYRAAYGRLPSQTLRG